MSNTLGAKPVIDTKDFQNGIRKMNSELKVLESGFKASVAGLSDWASTATGLESKIKSLTSQIDIQKDKVAATRSEWEKIKAEKGENTLAANALEVKLNKEIETLGKMESELGTSEQALNDLSTAQDEAGNSADEASGKVASMADVIGGIGSVVQGAVGLIAGLALAVGAVTTAIGGLVFTSAEAMGTLDDLSVKTGISSTRLQELDYIGSQLGVSQETMTGSLSKLTRTMSSAQTQYADYIKAQSEAKAKGEEFDGQLGDNAAAFDRLGINVLDANGNLRDSESVFSDTLKALGGIANEAERDALAMAIFGKSGMELNPLIKNFDEFPRMAQEAHELGAVVGEETKSAFAEFDDTLAGLKMGLQGTLTTLAGAFLPGFQMVFDQLGGYLREFSGIVNASDGDFGKLADGLGGLLGKIIGDVATQAPQMLEAGLGILQAIMDSIVANLPTLIEAAIGIITMLLDFIVQNLPTLIEAGLEILIALVQGITQALPTLIPAVVQALLTIVQTLVENLPMLIDAALQLILALADGLIAAIPILIPAIPVIIEALIAAIVQALPMIITAAMEIVNAMTLGILQNIPLLLTAAGQVLVALVTYLYQDGPKMFMDIGKSLIDGMWLGIKNNFGQLVANFKTLAGGLITTVKSVFDMKSPSRVGKDIGANFIGSIGLGGDDEAPKVRQMMTRQMLGLAADLSAVSAPQLGVPGMGAVGGGSSISIGDIIINIPGTNATPQQISVAVQDGVLKSLRSKGG